MATGMFFGDLDRYLASHPENLVVKPPSVSTKSKAGRILTGYINYITEAGTELNLTFNGPPCEAFRLVGMEGKVKYPKCTILLCNVEQLDADPSTEAVGKYIKVRTDFVRFVQRIEDLVKDQVMKDPAAFFLKELDASKIQVFSTIKPPPNMEDPLRMSCKIEVSDDVGANKEDMDPEHIRLEIVDAHDATIKYPIQEMRRGDVYVPVFSSAYPYFTSRGEIGMQWKLKKLVLLIRGPPMESKDDDFSEILKRYADEPAKEEAQEIKKPRLDDA